MGIIGRKRGEQASARRETNAGQERSLARRLNTSDRCITKLAYMSIDPQFVELIAEVFHKFFKICCFEMENGNGSLLIDL